MNDSSASTIQGVQISTYYARSRVLYSDIKKTWNKIATPATIYPYTVALYVAGIASFASFFLYYSQESNYFKESVLRSTHELGAVSFARKLQPDSDLPCEFQPRGMLDMHTRSESVHSASIRREEVLPTMYTSRSLPHLTRLSRLLTILLSSMGYRPRKCS